MNADGTLSPDEPEFGRSVIKSCAKLDYDFVEEMLMGTVSADPEQAAAAFATHRAPEQQPQRVVGPRGGRHQPHAIVQRCLWLHQLAQKVRFCVLFPCHDLAAFKTCSNLFLLTFFSQ